MRAKCAYYWQKMRLTYLSHFITRQSFLLMLFQVWLIRLPAYILKSY